MTFPKKRIEFTEVCQTWRQGIHSIRTLDCPPLASVFHSRPSILGTLDRALVKKDVLKNVLYLCTPVDVSPDNLSCWNRISVRETWKWWSITYCDVCISSIVLIGQRTLCITGPRANKPVVSLTYFIFPLSTKKYLRHQNIAHATSYLLSHFSVRPWARAAAKYVRN